MRYGSLPIKDYHTWASLNGIELDAARVVADILDKDGNSKGGGLVASRDVAADDVLLKVPAELIVCQSQVEQCAEVDGRLRELMDCMAEFTKTPRLKILIFLIYQMTMSSPDAEATARNKQSPQADYMRFLPKDIPLPTFYSEDERTLLTGTSLADALEQKLASLDKEFEAVRELTSSLPWFKQLWWHNETGILTFDDWKLADAMYRSRALELPGGVGDSMVPVVDMANHASDNRSNARFEVDQDGNALLLVRDEKSIASGDEITIMYGVGGACEMIFSYGFLEEGASSAREMFISLRIPEDDPLRMAKVRCAQEAPGVRVFVGDTGIPRWDSSYVWWACVNEEDGLDFRVVQTNDGQKELRVFWKDHEFDPSKLKQMVLADVLRDVFVLRATVLIQQRLESQGTALTSTEQAFDTAREVLTIREWIWKLVGRLRELELDVVAATFEQLDEEKGELMQTDTVRTYLGVDASQQAAGDEENFN